MSIRSIAEDLAKKFILSHLPEKLQGIMAGLHSVAAHVIELVPEGPDRDEVIEHLEKAGLALGKALLSRKDHKEDLA